VQQLPQIHSQLQKLQQDLKIHARQARQSDGPCGAAGDGQASTAMDLKVGEKSQPRRALWERSPPETGDKLAAEVDEYYLGRVQNGQIADIEIGDKTWALNVHPRIPESDETATFHRRFGPSGMPHTPQALLPGQALQGKLALGADRPATISFRPAHFWSGPAATWVFVLAKDGKFGAAPVRSRSARRNCRAAGSLERPSRAASKQSFQITRDLNAIDSH